jgi:hypothetical protein
MKTEYDVIVAGSGPAGFAAAYHAASNGADTLLIEKGGTIGGMLTTGQMGVFCGRASTYLYDEAGRTFGRFNKGGQLLYDVEDMRRFLFRRLEECGADLLVQAGASGVEKERQSITCLLVNAKEGQIRLKADIYIDATGDGDVAAAAGEKFDLGRADDGKFQPMTIIFSMAGVDRDAFVLRNRQEGRATLREKLLEYVDRGEISDLVGHTIVIEGFHPGTVKVNMTNVIDLDGTKSEDLARAEIACRKQLDGIADFLIKEADGFENAYVSSSADLMGVRSTRHFHGQYMINEKDISEGTVFDDWVVSHARYVWGTHNLYGPIGGKSQELSKKSPYGKLPHDKDYTIPFRSLRPAETDNLLLAGRCISGTFLAHSNYRVMPICMAMGQGAGTAAALAVKNGCSLDELDIAEVQKFLLEQGVEEPD